MHSMHRCQHRVAAIASDRQEMSRKLRYLADGKTVPGTSTSNQTVAGKIAFLFPGQGSQYLKMGSELAMTFPEAMAVWEKVPETASVVFPPRAYSPLEEQEQSRKLTSTEWAQPAVGAASAALLALLNQLEVRPDCVGGHSFGEITALFAAGGIGLDTMLAIARRRGELMRDSSTEPAGMLSVRSTWERIREALQGLAVTPANHNGPAQVVLSGAAGPLAEAERRLRDAGFAVIALPVSTAFHSPLMQSAADAFGEYLKQLPVHVSSLPFYSNRDGAPHSAEARAIAEDLSRQIAAPVHFGEMIERMYADGVRTFLEVGPRDVLTSLVGSILEGRSHQAIALDRTVQGGLQAFWEGLGALAVSGVAMNWKNFRQGHRVSTDLSLPNESKFSMPIDGGSYGRPYPPPGGAAALPPPVADASVVTAKGDSTEAYRVFQESISAAHRDWQANLAKGHEAFLRSMEAAFGSTHGNVSVDLRPLQAAMPAALPMQPVVKADVAAPPLPAASSRAVVWAVVAEKTGYPADMLEPAMALEADLGIDSIKRVEIFSTLQERFPALAGMESASLVSLHTLGDIVTALDGVAPEPQAAPAPAPTDSSSRGAVWEVVAEKTGYPADMLEPAMALEADLGIDSIKRVEIFSALQERFPSLADIESVSLVTLRTLGDIVTALDGAAQPDLPAPELPKRYIVSPRPKPTSGHAMLRPGESIVIAADTRGIATALAGMLEMRGYHATIGNDSSDANIWICLTQPHWQAFLFAKAASRRVSAFPGAFIAVEDSSRPWDGGLSGLAKTAALEWPGVRVKAIRIDMQNRAPEHIANALLDELLAGGPEPEIELAADGSRYAPELIETGWDSFDPALRAQLPSNPVIVATGGARGVTAACLQELAKTLRPRFVLFGRTPLADEPAATRSCPEAGSIQNALLAAFREEGRSISPLELKSQATEILSAREVRGTIQSLERAGAQVRYFALDVRDADAVGAALADVRGQWGPIHGVIHAAGVLADKLIADLTPGQFEAVFSTKVGGLRVLLNATAQDPARRALHVLLSRRALRQPGPGCLRYGERGSQSSGARRSATARRILHRKIHQLGPLGERNGHARPGSTFRRNERSTDRTGGRCKRVCEGNAERRFGDRSGDRRPAAGTRAGTAVHIQHATHPHLNDHVIQDIPVLPVVEAVGLMLRAAAEQGQFEQPAYCADVKVLRGIRLEKFHDGGNLAHRQTQRRDHFRTGFAGWHAPL